MADVEMTFGEGSDVYSISKRQIDSVSVLKQMTNDAVGLHYGSISATGKLEFRDVDNEFTNIVSKNWVKLETTPSKLYLNNKLIQNTYLTDVSIDGFDEKNISASLSSASSLFWDFRYEGRHLTEKCTAYDLTKEVLSVFFDDVTIDSVCLGGSYSDDAGEETTIASYLDGITIEYPYLKPDTMRATIDKICLLSMLYVYENVDGVPVFAQASGAFPSSKLKRDSFKIPSSHIVSLDSYDYVPTVYDGIRISECTNISGEDLVNATIDTSSSGNVDTFTQWKASGVGSEYTTASILKSDPEGLTSPKLYLYGSIPLQKKHSLNIDDYSFSMSIVGQLHTIKTFSTTTGINMSTSSSYMDTGLFDPSKGYSFDWGGNTYSILSGYEFNIAGELLNFRISVDKLYTTTTALEANKTYYFWDINSIQLYISTNKSAKTTSVYFDSGSPLNISYNELIDEIAIERINNSVKNWYSNGFRSATITIYNGDFKSDSGIKIFSNGDIIECGDLISVPYINSRSGIEHYWMVVGQEPKWDGESSTKLQLVEIVKSNYRTSGLYNENAELVKSWDALVADGDIVVDGSTLVSSVNTNMVGELVVSPKIYTIGDNALKNCYHLTNIELPKSIITIGNNAFYNCNSAKINVPENVGTIGEYAFYYCKCLGDITIPKTLKTVGIYAFYDSGVSSVNITDILSWLNIDFLGTGANPVQISENLYLNGELLTNLVIPEGTTIIKNYAFGYCKSITTLSLPESLLYISDDSFTFCNSLTDFTFPNNLIEIGVRSFAMCDKLTYIKIPDSVKYIEDSSFLMTNGVTMIDLRDVTDVPILGSSAFDGLVGGVYGPPPIVVPDALYDSFIVANNWSTYANYIHKASEV